MRLVKLIATFGQDEEGAVTVDWVVLTAAVVGLAIALFVTIGNSSDGYAKRIRTHISAEGIKTDFGS